MMLAHIIDDFVLQPICLSKLKQREWWEEKLGGKDKLDKSIYHEDYKWSLITHGLSWSIMVHLPIMLILSPQYDLALLGSVVGNAFIHAAIDDVKANKKTMDLMTDQQLHYIQLIIIFFIFTFI